MRKEVIVAILIGLILGLVITYGVHQSRQTLDDTTPKPEVINSGENGNDSDQELAIASPEDEIIVSEKSLTVTGTTTANNIVVVFVNDAEIITNADDTGNFSVEVTLLDGVNIISIHSLNEDGNAVIQERTVTVYTGSLENNESENDLEATNSGETSEIEDEDGDKS